MTVWKKWKRQTIKKNLRQAHKTKGICKKKTIRKTDRQLIPKKKKDIVTQTWCKKKVGNSLVWEKKNTVSITKGHRTFTDTAAAWTSDKGYRAVLVQLLNDVHVVDIARDTSDTDGVLTDGTDASDVEYEPVTDIDEDGPLDDDDTSANSDVSTYCYILEGSRTWSKYFRKIFGLPRIPILEYSKTTLFWNILVT